jgi:hypothetical protein
MRNTHASVEQLYRDGMAALFNCGDPIYALKLRESTTYQGRLLHLDYSVDTLHSIIVGLI